MAGEQYFIVLIIIISSFTYNACAQANKYPCLRTLLPCASFLKSPNTPPPACCVPLKDAVTNDADCLCNLFNDKEILKKLNVSPEEALKLPSKCGINADLTKCNAASGANDTQTPPAPAPATPTPTTPAAPPTTPETPTTTPATPPTPAASDTPSDTSSSAKSSSNGVGFDATSAVAMVVGSIMVYITVSN